MAVCVCCRKGKSQSWWGTSSWRRGLELPSEEPSVAAWASRRRLFPGNSCGLISLRVAEGSSRRIFGCDGQLAGIWSLILGKRYCLHVSSVDNIRKCKVCASPRACRVCPYGRAFMRAVTAVLATAPHKPLGSNATRAVRCWSGDLSVCYSRWPLTFGRGSLLSARESLPHLPFDSE